MLTKYKSFLLEKLVEDLSMLLEGNIHASSDFISKLKHIKNVYSKSDKDKEVYYLASSLLQLVKHSNSYFDDEDIKQNYFDVTKSDDRVSFIQHNRVSYGDNPYTLSGRSEMKIGRIVKYLSVLLNLKPSNKAIEDFVNLYKSTNVDDDKTFKLVSGDEINKYYKSNIHASDSGSLGYSCMNDMGKKLFKLYTKNPDKVKLLVYLNKDGELLGRALVWKLDKSPSPSKYFMDRVYFLNDSDVNKFIQFAIDNDWMYKKRMNSDDSDGVYFLYNRNSYHGEISVKLKGDFKLYPYLDTLTFLNKKKNEISNLSSKNCYLLNDHEDGERYHCYDCNGDLYEVFGFGGEKTICFACCAPHIELNGLGIKTKVFKKYG